MGKNIDYSKLKAMHQSIIDYIGDDNDTGDQPKDFKGYSEAETDQDFNSESSRKQSPGPSFNKSLGEQEPLLDMTPAADDNENLPGFLDRADGDDVSTQPKKRKDDFIKLSAAMLRSKFMKNSEQK